MTILHFIDGHPVCPECFARLHDEDKQRIRINEVTSPPKIYCTSCALRLHPPHTVRKRKTI